jgi:hypothetical protein
MSAGTVGRYRYIPTHTQPRRQREGEGVWVSLGVCLNGSGKSYHTEVRHPDRPAAIPTTLCLQLIIVHKLGKISSFREEENGGGGCTNVDVEPRRTKPLDKYAYIG